MNQSPSNKTIETQALDALQLLDDEAKIKVLEYIQSLTHLQDPHESSTNPTDRDLHQGSDRQS
jgi:hypothetical protein